MQCPSCRAVYSNGLEVCPRCRTAAPATNHLNENDSVSAPQQETINANGLDIADDPRMDDEVTTSELKEDAAATPAKSSTLIEFPGTRAALPQWRKDLSERVREIQERRAREAALEAEEAKRRRVEQPAATPAATAPLGLVPQPETPAVNPLVVKALRRIERAQQPTQPMPRARGNMGGGAAAATARVAEEQFQEETVGEPALAARPLAAPLPVTESKPSEKPAEVAREHNLVIVPPVVEKEEKKKPEPRRVFEGVVDDSVASRLETEILPSPSELLYDDRASVMRRFGANLIDLLVVAFASSPFAAIIELTNGNWTDVRVSASMGGIVVVVMFLYFASSTALSGRTWGMSLFSLRAVDVNTGLHPTTKQSIGRALLYMLSLATLCLGIIYAFFDAEGRTAHDIFTGTTVVREES